MCKEVDVEGKCFKGSQSAALKFNLTYEKSAAGYKCSLCNENNKEPRLLDWNHLLKFGLDRTDPLLAVNVCVCVCAPSQTALLPRVRFIEKGILCLMVKQHFGFA